MPRTLSLLALGLAAAGGCAPAPADEPLDRRFADQVRPFFERYCFGCHGPQKKKGDLDLSRDFGVEAIARNPRQWEIVQGRLKDRDMPPEESKTQPRDEERAAALAWLRDLDDREAARHAGDPGVVLARRLSNAEVDCTVRDLTGVDIRPTREFPVDPANEAGFDNSGESLTMSEALLKKYLGAARLVADHVVLKKDGFVFAPHPVVTDTDRDKYCVTRIVDFYNRHKVDLADYFFAAWEFRRHTQLSLTELAHRGGLGLNYLSDLYSLLQVEAGGPIGEIQAAWRKLPDGDPVAARRGCEELRDLATRLRAAYPATAENLLVKGISKGSQWLLLWRNDQLAAQRRKAAGDAARFCEVFPDAFVVLERGPYYDKSSSPKGRFLSAGFHLMQGYYRDDLPLYQLALTSDEQREIDTLWDELHFISQDSLRQYRDFIFFERAEPPRFMFDAAFDFARSEDKDATSEPKIRQLKEAYLAKAREKGASATALAAIESYFVRMNAEIRRVEQARLAAEPGHLEALLTFTARAWRRPLSTAERDGLLAFYRRLREADHLDHEEAFRDTLASLLLSPHFLYRIDAARGATSPLSSVELASRLSYFLWSSMPDEELLASDLSRPEALVAQARRLLRDPRVRGFATEFAGNWLDVRRFEEHNAVDRDRFPQFSNELRQAMFEEPIRYIIELVQRDRPVLDLLYGRDTFVNPALARHYGMPEPKDWTHIEDARAYGRGGLLTMSVFLTKNAPGLRTSPVKRGYWVVRRLLGEVIPPPPPTVPTLPKDEAALGELTLPQVLARHRDDPACAGCHRRFDSVGVAFEGYGPVGEKRDKDLGGKPVQISAPFPDGRERGGVDGLRDYLREKRQAEFTGNLSRKLLSYALGRSLQPSDRKTLDAMQARPDFGGMIEEIVTSPQFRNKRGPE